MGVSLSATGAGSVRTRAARGFPFFMIAWPPTFALLVVFQYSPRARALQPKNAAGAPARLRSPSPRCHTHHNEAWLPANLVGGADTPVCPPGHGATRVPRGRGRGLPEGRHQARGQDWGPR